MHTITEINSDHLCIAEACEIKGSLLSSAFTEASDLAVVFCTIGPDLENEKAQLKASSPLSPGMQGFPISEQWCMAQLAPIEEIGLELTSSGMMNPQKSLSMIIGFGEEMPTWSRAEACARCNLAKSCRYRIRNQTHSAGPSAS